MKYQPPFGSTDPDASYVDKDSPGAVRGSAVPGLAIEDPQRELADFIAKSGFTPTEQELQLAFAIQSGKVTYAVASGSANAWVVDPVLAVPAYAAGRVLWIIAPATNTSTTVNANVSGLGNRRIKKANGQDPQPSDLVSGVAYPTLDDGTNIRVLSTLASDRLAEVYLGFSGAGTSISYANDVNTLIASYGGSPVNNLPAATYSAGVITIGTSGFYFCSANMLSLMPGGANYGFGLAISKVNGGGVPLVSVTATQITVSTASLSTNLATSVGATARLNAGDRIAGFFRHNQGSAQNATISIDIEFRGA